jgi:4-hydroxy-tetrahydrodipicolinate reductase
MRIAIVGYGRMGQEVERVARARGHDIGRIIDPALTGTTGASAPGVGGMRTPAVGDLQAAAVTPEALSGCDVAIEFSLADAVRGNVRAYAEAGLPAVLGTTGWLDHLDEIRELVTGRSGALVYGSNFSIGANLFFRLAAYASSLVREVDEYDLMIHETHHRGKKDSPSGTALTLARAVLEQVPRKDTIETGRLDRAPEPNELHVSSTRGGSVPGTHTLYLDSDADSIEVTHRARNRGGFALGAVRAAEWIVERRGVFTVAQFIDGLIETV